MIAIVYKMWFWSLKQDMLEDPAIISAIDEETEFNALVVRDCTFLIPVICYC